MGGGLVLFAQGSKKYLSSDTLSKIARKTRFCSTHANKNKTNPRENLEFVLFYTRDYLGLSVKFRISRISKDKGRDIFSPFNLCYRLFIDFVVYARIFYIF